MKRPEAIDDGFRSSVFTRLFEVKWLELEHKAGLQLDQPWRSIAAEEGAQNRRGCARRGVDESAAGVIHVSERDLEIRVIEGIEKLRRNLQSGRFPLGHDLEAL